MDATKRVTLAEIMLKYEEWIPIPGQKVLLEHILKDLRKLWLELVVIEGLESENYKPGL